MYSEDIELLRCPISKKPIEIVSVQETAEDGEIIRAILSDGVSSYQISNGIPRFVSDISYNKSWDFKWTELDKGEAYNYRILDREDAAYAVHDIFDRNSHDGRAFRHAKSGLVLDIGCGIGQYAVKMAMEHGARKVVAVDLTHGVDFFRKILKERYPEYFRKIVIVQASIFSMPFANEQFDYVYSLGVLMHTGDTLKALDTACKLVRPQGEINVWVYGSEPVAYDVAEPSRSADVLSLANFAKFRNRLKFPMFWIHLFRRVGSDQALRIIKFFSSDFVYNLSKKRHFGWIGRIFPNVQYPQYEYRLINNFDGYVNNWCDTWSEHELFPVMEKNSIAILGVSSWRVGLWGRKMPGFYAPAA